MKHLDAGIVGVSILAVVFSTGFFLGYFTGRWSVRPAAQPIAVLAQPSAPRPVQQPVKKASPPVRPATIAAFNDPERACGLLSSQGLVTSPMLRPGPKWHLLEGSYTGMSEMDVTPGGFQYVGDVANTITYMLSSDVPDHVESVELQAKVFNLSHETPIVEKFRSCSTALFTALEIEAPRPIIDAIASSQSAVANMPYGRITVERQKFNLGYGLQLTIEDATALGP